MPGHSKDTSVLNRLLLLANCVLGAHRSDDPHAPKRNRAQRFGASYPSHRLADFLAETEIACLNLADVFADYAAVNNLAPPYFEFERDGHWDTLGHRIAAEAISPLVSPLD